MASKYLSSLSKEKYQRLTEKLLRIQNNVCFICGKKIDVDIQTTNIDHIVPLANKGKDAEDNFAVTHESCNKSKQDANLRIAKVLYIFKEIQKQVQESENKSASLKHVLQKYDGSKYQFKHKFNGEKIEYSFSEVGNNNLYQADIFVDNLSKEKSCFIKVPLQYIFHDEIINPRGVNSSISKLIKEFEKGNPQLHLSLARLDEGKIKIFDGQHKAVAQILLGIKELVVRIFIAPNVDRLTETNTNAGSVLRQIAFDKSIMRQLNNTLYFERVKNYQEDHNLSQDDFSFSEQQLVDYFKGENVNIKKYIIDSIKHSITNERENKLKDFIDFEGKAKELPISYSAYDKTFLASLIDSKLILKTTISYKTDAGLNPRELEIDQIIRLLNIVAEEIYINKFQPETGVYQVENKIVNNQDTKITDDHLIAYRMSREEILFNWLRYLKEVIRAYFINTGKIIEESKMFQYQFDEQVWINIRNFIHNLKELPLWKNRSMAATIFAGKNNYDYWKTIFESGKSPDGADVLTKPINFIEMINNLQGE